MKRNRMIFLLFVTLLITRVYAQDGVLVPLDPHLPAATLSGLRQYNTIDTVEVTLQLPPCFSGVTVNKIEDEGEALLPILEKLRLLKLGATADTLRILHIGDSHIRGRILPNTAAAMLTNAFGPVSYTEMGVNGATTLTFTHPLRIQQIIENKPDLLILSFGTNESHNKRYNPQAHYRQMDELITLIKKDLPQVPMLFTTPPGSYESVRRRRRQRTYTINPRTVIAVDTIRRYATEHNIAVWDMYNILGGPARACKNWTEAGLMRPDHVHYLPEAYKLQGELLFQAIINAYNAYVTL